MLEVYISTIASSATWPVQPAKVINASLCALGASVQFWWKERKIYNKKTLRYGVCRDGSNLILAEMGICCLMLVCERMCVCVCVDASVLKKKRKEKKKKKYTIRKHCDMSVPWWQQLKIGRDRYVLCNACLCVCMCVSVRVDVRWSLRSNSTKTTTCALVAGYAWLRVMCFVCVSVHVCVCAS